MEGRQLISSGSPWELVVGYSREVRPANTTVVVAALLDAAWKVEIEVEAVCAPDRVPR